MVYVGLTVCWKMVNLGLSDFRCTLEGGSWGCVAWGVLFLLVHLQWTVTINCC